MILVAAGMWHFGNDQMKKEGLDMGKIYLLSYGVQTSLGFRLLLEAIPKESLWEKKWLIIVGKNYFLTDKIEAGLQKLGVAKSNVEVYLPDRKEQITSQKFDYIYVAEGNTFELLDYVREQGLSALVQSQVKQGADYIGISAGAHLAGRDISTAIGFDENGKKMKDLTALGLFSGVVIPHYTSMEIARYLAYKEAKKNTEYENVYTVGEEEILIL